ncbi:MAG: GMC family oxidoreductase, partial [Acidobacteriia bacterium]|nr:GMC family oxidoreductase [Terriglobia bacterium]
MAKKTYDALIVGSGASGGWVAKELCERGLRVLMLEAGPPRIPTRDFTEHVWPYQLKFRGFGNTNRLLADQPIQRLCYACDEYSHQFFVNDHEHPYTFPADKPFMWIRGRQVGGKTFCWARESYRFSDYEFQAARRDGYGEDWPLSYKELEPYYDRVESFIGVSGSREGLEQFPDGKFLPPMNLSCGGRLAKKVIEEKFGWRVMPDRVANLTVEHNGRPACHYCGTCQRGCHTASYFNSPSVTLPAAARTGRFTLVSDAVVSHVVMDENGKARGVAYIDRTTRAAREAYAKVIVLAASTLESTRILLNYWFETDHRLPNGTTFKYHRPQREAIETLIYLYEVAKVRRHKNLVENYAGSKKHLRLLQFDEGLDERVTVHIFSNHPAAIREHSRISVYNSWFFCFLRDSV